MRETKTVYSVFIALSDQVAIQYGYNTSVGDEIYIGNDSSSPFSLSNSLCGTISG